MLLTDSLIVIGMATVSLGTIQEADGPKEHTFWLRNAGDTNATLQQGYTSCGCTTIHFDRQRPIAPGDSAKVKLHFNPRGKGGEFHETGTLVYGAKKKRLNVTMTGRCVTSEETLLRQFPIRISDHLRLSARRFDVGVMHAGESKERHVVVLHRDEQNRQERIAVRLTIDKQTPKGLQHISRPITVRSQGQSKTLQVVFDVMIR